MHLRKSLVAAAGIVAAGLMAISGSALAATGTVHGEFVSGTATFLGNTYGCTGGNADGVYDTVNNPALDFDTLNITCSTPVGNAQITVDPSCTIPVNLTAGRTAGVDTAVTGKALFGTGTCVKVSALAGICTANVQGNNIDATFDETTGSQKLVLNGPGTLANQSPGCGGALAGDFILNDITFSMVGTPAPINFV